MNRILVIIIILQFIIIGRLLWVDQNKENGLTMLEALLDKACYVTEINQIKCN